MDFRVSGQSCQLKKTDGHYKYRGALVCPKTYPDAINKSGTYWSDINITHSNTCSDNMTDAQHCIFPDNPYNKTETSSHTEDLQTIKHIQNVYSLI